MKRPTLIELLNKAVKQLEDKINELPIEHQIKVEIPTRLETLNLDTHFGKVFVIPIGGQLSKPDDPHAVLQRHDFGIGVIVGIRYQSDKPEPLFYVEYVLDALSGMEIENNREDGEYRTYSTNWEPYEEKWKANEWWYRILFILPCDYYEEEFGNQLIK